MPISVEAEMKKALFIDRDGVINKMVKYGYGWDSPQKPQDVRLIAGIEKVISWAHQHTILVIEVSNQPGVAIGKMDQKTSVAIEDRIHLLLRQKGSAIDATYRCPHHPEAVVAKLKKICDCRKPKPGLLVQAAKDLGIDFSTSIFLGDKATDVQAAANVGVASLIYLHNWDEPAKNKDARRAHADFRASSMQGVLNIIKVFFTST